MKKNKQCKFGLNSCYFDGKEERKNCCAINSSLGHSEIIDNEMKQRMVRLEAIVLAQERVCKAAAAYISAWNEYFEFALKAEYDTEGTWEFYQPLRDDAITRKGEAFKELNAALISLQKIGYNFK